MTKVNVDALIKENMILMKQIKENREKFWKWVGEKTQKRTKNG